MSSIKLSSLPGPPRTYSLVHAFLKVRASRTLVWCRRQPIEPVFDLVRKLCAFKQKIIKKKKIRTHLGHGSAGQRRTVADARQTNTLQVGIIELARFDYCTDL